MWDEQKHSRFQELRQREDQHVLTKPEQTELAELLGELEATEASYLIPATQRLHEQRKNVEAQNRILQALVARRDALVREVCGVLARAKEERLAIDRELAAVLAEAQEIDE